jgi:hypothetical protein
VPASLVERTGSAMSPEPWARLLPPRAVPACVRVYIRTQKLLHIWTWLSTTFSVLKYKMF